MQALNFPGHVENWNLEQAAAYISAAKLVPQLKSAKVISPAERDQYESALRHSAGMHIASVNAVIAARRIQIGPLDV